MKGIVPCLILAAALSGCTTPEEEAPDLLGACPQWIAGPEFETTVQGNGTAVIEANGSVPAQHQGYPLDMHLLRVEADAPVELRARDVEGDRRLQFHVQDGDDVHTRPFITVHEEREVQLFLSPVAHGAEPSPSSVLLTAQGAGEVDVHVTPFYRVCGVLLET